MDKFDFRNALEAFAKIDTAMPLSAMQALIWVGTHEGYHQNDLEAYLGTSNATASRSVSYWSDWKSFKDKKRGQGYIESTQDPMDRRLRQLRLTPMGRTFLNETFGAPDGKTKR